MHLPPRAKLIGSSSHSRPTATHQARIRSRLIPYQLGTSRPQVRDILTSAADATKSSRLGTTSVYPSSPFPSQNRFSRLHHCVPKPFLVPIRRCSVSLSSY